MAPLDIDTALDWRGRTVRGADGEKIGTFGDVFLDQETDRPAWAGVRTGLFGRHESYIPLDRVEDDGEDLRVPFDKQLVKDAPRIDPDVALSTEEEQALFAHYGREYVRIAGSDPADAPDTGERLSRDDDAMTRSEEEVAVHEGPMRPTERVRLRKVQVTEHQRRVIPVQREVIAVETDDVEDSSTRTTPDDR
jgi:hypothetical protein